MEITYQERIGEDGEQMAVPVIPAAATADERAVLEAEWVPAGDVSWFQRQVSGLSHSYLRSRGLSPSLISRFGGNCGGCGAGRCGVWVSGRGISVPHLIYNVRYAHHSG